MNALIRTAIDTIRNEPAVVVSSLTALIGLAVTLGLVDSEQAKTIVGAVVVVVPMLGGFLIRSQVTPTAAKHAA